MIKYVIFDFDGTLADSQEAVISVYNQLAKKNNFRKMEHKDIEYLRTLTVKERTGYLNVPLYKIPFWANDFYKLYKKAFAKVVLFDGMKEVLVNLQKKGYRLAIISSNSEENIKAFLEKNDIDNIQDIIGSNNIFGKDKSLVKFLKRHDLKKHEVIYVGDEERDISACKKTGVKIICVDWGLDSIELVKKNNPDYIVLKPDDILHAVKQAAGC